MFDLWQCFVCLFLSLTFLYACSLSFLYFVFCLIVWVHLCVLLFCLFVCFSLCTLLFVCLFVSIFREELWSMVVLWDSGHQFSSDLLVPLFLFSFFTSIFVCLFLSLFGEEEPAARCKCSRPLGSWPSIQVSEAAARIDGWKRLQPSSWMAHQCADCAVWWLNILNSSVNNKQWTIAYL